MFTKEMTPKLFSLLKKGISRKQFSKDIISGIIIGIIALPLAIAFAIASGVSPEKGILTAIIGGFIISLFGGSRVQIGGPTGAFIIIIYSIIAKHGIDGLLISTFLAGIILVLMGILRLGSLLKYIPQTLIIGFTSAIAVIIFTTQVKDFLGISIENLPSEFIAKWFSYYQNLDTTNLWALFLGLSTILMLTLLPKITTRIPWTFVALIVTSLIAYFFNLPVDTIYSRFGEITFSIPTPSLLTPDINTIKTLMIPAVTIAILGALESLLSAVVADGMIGGKHRSNIELIAQGLANIVLPIFGGIPATGAIARTATNIKNGGRTPIAGIVHALTLFLIYLVAMPIVKYIPMATLAGVLIVVAWNMAEAKIFIRSLKINLYESIVLLTTFFMTLLTDLTIAIPVGFILSIILFMKRMSDSMEINPLMTTKTGTEILFSQEIGEYSNKIIIFEINGPIFFGSVHHLLNLDKEIQQQHKVIILRFRYVPILDTSGLIRLQNLVLDSNKRNIRIILSGVNEKVSKKLLNNKIVKESEIYLNIKDAIVNAEKIINK